MEVFTTVDGCLRYWHVGLRWRGLSWIVTARSRAERYEGGPAGWRASRDLMALTRTEIETAGRPLSLRAVHQVDEVV
ncbi:hypothetical protein Lfu02_25730 [Longispora fulva]|uniref:Uncharacterized protein n=1 Tax=Longispora fulva TaxID=619741 RepID=A0A8J7GDR3_9ACTN|nr:hypothetical protein [Longispora fulva]MBG6138708.1 hypothetical protein [Longispora fulva]GIG58201.1 hypothetical protein Lfu02_25730 [Longispora fulva]